MAGKAFNCLLSLMIFVVLFGFSSAARSGIRPNAAQADPPAAISTTKACDPVRFSSLGLNMNDFKYCNSSLPIPIRVKDLVDSMTLSEKVKQLGDEAYGADRIGLPKYEWWSEALHGVSNVGNAKSIGTFFDDVVPGATSFPTPILTTASFNESLWKKIGQVVSTEARAMYNLAHAGLTFWSPNINTVRDPRWGRAQETPGEDPFVAGRYAVNYVRGLQDVEGKESCPDGNARPLKVAACCKHYVAYDVDNWFGVLRFNFDAKVREQDMIETFQKPFEMCVLDGDVASVMCSYNQVNGIPTCADPVYLKETIRGKWDLHGYIVSDCDSIQVFVDDQHFLNDKPEDGVSQVLRAGLDLDCGQFYTNYTENALILGKVRESDIDIALKNLYTTLMRLGFFDGAPEYEKLGKCDICSEEHISLAIEAAREGIVLLKNDNQALPLKLDAINTLAVIGPHGNVTSPMIGNYAGIPCRYTSPLDAFKQVKEVIYEIGCDSVACMDDTLIFPAMQAAKTADATVIVVGLDLSIEAEALDRTDLLLPGYQTQLINQVSDVSKGPVVLVVISAGCIDISFAKSNPKIPAILWAGYPGQEGGHGIADIVFGKYNPGGKLPLTWYENSYVDRLPMTSMPLRPVDNLGYPGRTYKFFNGPVVYPFGYGLSYTTFNYTIANARTGIEIELDEFTHCRDLYYAANVTKPPCPAVLVDDLSTPCAAGQYNLEFDVQVENTGKIDGSETVMVYWVPPYGVLDAPIKQLIAFRKTFLATGQSATLHFNLDACKSLSLVDFRAYTILSGGIHTIVLGDNVASFPLTITLKNHC